MGIITGLFAYFHILCILYMVVILIVQVSPNFVFEVNV